MFMWTKLEETDKGFTLIRCPAPLLPSLVEVTTGAHEATDHGRNDADKQENGGGDAG